MQNSLEICIIKGYCIILSEILNSYSDILKYTDLNGNSLLHLAAKEGNQEMIQILLDKFIDIESINMYG